VSLTTLSDIRCYFRCHSVGVSGSVLSSVVEEPSSAKTVSETNLSSVSHLLQFEKYCVSSALRCSMYVLLQAEHLYSYLTVILFS